MSEVEGKIAQQPNSNAPPTGKWTTGLYDCFDDKGNSATHARWIFFGLGCLGLHCLYSYKFRIKLRSLYNLPEEPYSDCCVHYFCLLCAICQEHRELKNRGLDPSIDIHLLIHGSYFILLFFFLSIICFCFSFKQL
ncbi:hypothetical protein V8G54_011881 [Vigna mungo]|uniref:Uncharacterized protein n=1 Tax=Vigna mungo TaxID=3915 RepID=A0AAQ3NR06_VIGMU